MSRKNPGDARCLPVELSLAGEDGKSKPSHIAGKQESGLAKGQRPRAESAGISSLQAGEDVKQRGIH